MCRLFRIRLLLSQPQKQRVRWLQDHDICFLSRFLKNWISFCQSIIQNRKLAILLAYNLGSQVFHAVYLRFEHKFSWIDGTRLIRKFLKESKVIMIFEYLRSTIDQSFEVTCFLKKYNLILTSFCGSFGAAEKTWWIKLINPSKKQG